MSTTYPSSTDNWQQDIYMRPTFYKSDLGIGVRLHDLKDDLTMWSVPFQKYIKNDTSAHVTISSWRRIDDDPVERPVREVREERLHALR